MEPCSWNIRAKMQMRIVIFVVGFLTCICSGTLTAVVHHCPPPCACLGNMVDCSRKSLAVIPENMPDWVEMLDLSKNSISTFNLLVGLDQLTEINLCDNQLESFNLSACFMLPKLTSLKLSHNRIQQLVLAPYLEEDVRAASCNITQLILSHNGIKSLDRAFLSSLPSLRVLDLGHNRLSKLDNNTFPFMLDLHHLFLNSNSIEFVSKGLFDNLVSLEWLKLNQNKLRAIPKGLFSPLHQLKDLELESNRIRVIEGLAFQGLENLLSLKLKRNSISTLMDGAFWGIGRIQVLDLSYNNITKVGNKWLYGLESLRHLSLAHNRIEQIEVDAWKFCRHLTELNLRHNLLTTLTDKTFSNLESLQQLHLQHNKLSYILDGAFRGLSALTVLDLSYNEISWKVEDMNGGFDGLLSLNRLLLEHNRIKSISKRAFQELSKLRQLHLGDNSISSVQANAFEDLKDLKDFRLNSSQFLCDCQLLWLVRWVREAGFESTVNAVCSYPESLLGRNVFDIKNTSVLKCINFPKPIITQEPQSQMALRYGNATLTCQAASTSESPLTIEWKKNNIILTDSDVVVNTNSLPSKDGVIQLVSVLHMWPVKDEHAGIYQCVASNILGSSYSNKVSISVNVFPVFLKTPNNIVVKAGATARLDCAAAGFPQPEIALQKDGGDNFPAARERRMHIYPSDEMFFIVEVNSEDQGIYTCIAKNDVGMVTANATLQVLEAPSFVRQMEDKTTFDGDTTVLECMTSGSPKPRLEWLKDGRPLQPTLRHFFTADDQLLVIVQTGLSDGGDYTCIMTNTLGSERQTARLVVARPGGTEVASISDYSTMTGIIVISVVCCIVGTSIIWVFVIYKCRQRQNQKRFRMASLEDPGLSGYFGIGTARDYRIGESQPDCSNQGLLFSTHTDPGSIGVNPIQRILPCDMNSLSDDDENVEIKRNSSFLSFNRHGLDLPDDTMFCRHRSDSGTHTLGSSASHSTSGNVELPSAFQPLQRSLDDCTIRKNVIAADNLCCNADAAACSNSKSMSDSNDDNQTLRNNNGTLPSDATAKLVHISGGCRMHDTRQHCDEYCDNCCLNIQSCKQNGRCLQIQNPTPDNLPSLDRTVSSDDVALCNDAVKSELHCIDIVGNELQSGTIVQRN